MDPRLEPAGLSLRAASAGWVLGPPSSGSRPGQRRCALGEGSSCCLPSWVRASPAQCKNPGGRTGGDGPWWECDPNSQHSQGRRRGQGTQTHLSAGLLELWADQPPMKEGTGLLTGRTDLCLHSDNPLLCQCAGLHHRKAFRLQV